MKFVLYLLTILFCFNVLANESCTKKSLLKIIYEVGEVSLQNSGKNKLLDERLVKILNGSDIFKAEDISVLINRIKHLLSQNIDKVKKKKLKNELLKLRALQKKEGNLQLVGRDNIFLIKEKKYYNANIKIGNKSHKIKIIMDEKLSSEEEKKYLSKFVAFFSLTPKKVINSVDQIVIHHSPHEEHSSYLALSEYLVNFKNKQNYYKVVTKDKSFHTLDSQYGMFIYFHELGHAFSKKRFGMKVPPGYDDIIKADGISVSKYGETNLQEDFAETFALYLLLKEGKSYDKTAFSKIQKSIFDKRTNSEFHLVSEKIIKQPNELTPRDIREMYKNRFDFLEKILEKDPTFKDRVLLHLKENEVAQATLFGGTGLVVMGIVLDSVADK